MVITSLFRLSKQAEATGIPRTCGHKRIDALETCAAIGCIVQTIYGYFQDNVVFVAVNQRHSDFAADRTEETDVFCFGTVLGLCNADSWQKGRRL